MCQNLGVDEGKVPCARDTDPALMDPRLKREMTVNKHMKIHSQNNGKEEYKMPQGHGVTEGFYEEVQHRLRAKGGDRGVIT